MSQDPQPLDPQRRRKHRLLLELGRGGMGTVYLATRDGAASAPLVVIKRLNPELASDPEFRQMFLDEARLALRLAHANIVRTTDVGFDGRHYFIEMEYLEGQPFDAVLRYARKTQRLALPHGLCILRETLLGLHAAHELEDERGAPLEVVHRDVSPHNVFVTYDGDVKILDFGIAKASDSSSRTRTGVVKGKVNYMAPEQAARAKVDRRADVFSVGIMLWQTITGTRFWEELGEHEIFDKLRRGEFRSPRTDQPEMDARLEGICMRALALRAEDRFATAASFAEALDAFRRDAGEMAERADLAPFMRASFAEQRSAAQAEVARHLEEASEHVPFDVDVPLRGGSQSYPMTLGMEADRVTAALGPERATGMLPVPATRRGGAYRRARVVLPAIGIVAIAGSISGALLLERREAAPAARAMSCSRAEDCAAAGKGLVCGGAGVCVAPSRCATNAECVLAHGGEAFACRHDSGLCVALESTDCHVQASDRDIGNDATIWIGTMFPLTGADGEAFGVQSSRAAEVARQDFMKVAGGLPSPTVGKPSRPLGIIACDDSADAERAARHLVDDVGVPAIIGFHTSKQVVDLATSLFIPRGVLAVASLNQSALITQIPHDPGSPRLVWRTASSTLQTLPPLSALIDGVVAPRLRATRALGPKDSLRVAFLRTGTAAGIANSDSIFSALTFNGKPALQNGRDFHEFVYGDPNELEGVPSYDEAVRGVLAWKPHVVLYTGTSDQTKDIIEPIEAGWPARAAFRPHFLLPAEWEGERFFRFLGKDDERRRRFLGLSTPTSTEANAKFTMRYNETFSPHVSQEESPGAPYDSFYLLAYAAYALGDEPITGRALATSIARLIPPADPIDVGPGRIFDAFNALRAGKNIDLNGASSRMDFDLATGESPADFVVMCIDVDAAGNAFDNVESGLVYDAKSGRLDGTLRCP